jgi:PRTRC genetic system protein B
MQLDSPPPQPYALRRALLLYEARRQGYAYGDVDRAPASFASVHEVTHGPNGAALEPGVLLSEDALASVVTDLTGGRGLEYLPERVLAFAPGIGIAWWSPAGERPLFFRTDRFGSTEPDAFLNEQVHGHAYPVPALVFVVRGSGLRLYALADDRRPTPETPLYRAPFYNLYAAGNVCTGSMPAPKGVTPANTDAYERAYFGSNFSHPNAAPLLDPRAWRGSYGEAWLEARSRARFPSEWLVEQGKTLAEALK